ncbi:MAG TPA: tetratricopeptide repeat protein [Gemmatimonadaceae bacterium]|jgi:tetratricopeptide (TPR) repeat protein
MSIEIQTKAGLFALMEQIAQERLAARAVIDQLATRESIEDIEIPLEWRTAGFVHELAEYAFSKLESDPLQSLAFAHLGLAVITSISPDNYASPIFEYLDGHAWKEIGYAHRYLCSYTPALNAFQASEESFSNHSSLYGEEMGARFARACILALTREYQAALALNSSTLHEFRSLGDRRREILCEVLQAAIFHWQGEFEAARNRYESLLEVLRESDDSHTIGVLYNNLGNAYASLGRISDAVIALERAREIFIGLDMPGEVNRADAGLASVMVSMGDVHNALPILRRLRDDYLRRHMPEEAGEIGLLIVDALIATEQTELARVLTAQILQEFIDAKLNHRAITAIAYLRDLLQTAGDSRAGVRHVRSYVEKLRSEPALLFIPPEEDK